MSLIKSISGIRGTIGGKPGQNLTPEDVVKFTAAFGTWIKNRGGNSTVIIGRDARLSGEIVSLIVSSTLRALGMHVVDLGLSTTPTVEIAVQDEKAGGGIIITASHNPVEWNALKLLNEKGEFISDADGQEVLKIAEDGGYDYVEVKQLGSYHKNDSYINKHIKKIIALPLVNTEAIRDKNYRIVVDSINSSGGIVIPDLLQALGVKEVVELNGEPTGIFAHNPEPLSENLQELSEKVKFHKADMGIAVDPDVDRLAFVCENGSMFGEEYTLVSVSDYILRHDNGNTVSNLSSTRALRDVTLKAGGKHYAAPVGEVNVVEKMKEVNAVIGGEGNGGIIYPELHYGRDALVGIALFLSHLAMSGKKCSELRASYPDYVISKKKIALTPGVELDKIFERIKKKYSQQPVNTEDGVKIEFDESWVHLRKSNTEPIIRIYAEGRTQETADALANNIIEDIRVLLME